MAYASVYFYPGDTDNSDGLVTTMPIGVIVGTCDGAVGTAGLSYIDDAKGKNTSGLYGFTTHGANYNFFTTAWSPSSGNAGAIDEAADDRFRPRVCGTPDGDRRLTKDEQRTIATTHVVAFFRKTLLGESP
jgi:hypothetical protein